MRFELLLPLITLFVAGCTGQLDIAEISKTLPEVEAFLDAHPDTTILSVLLDEEDIVARIDEIRAVCGEQVEIKPYYQFDLDSPELTTRLWVDAKTLNIVCSITQTIRPETPLPPLLDTPQAPITSIDKENTPIKINADDDPVLGDPNAPITIIEFSDFQCPFCRRYYTNTLPQLRVGYIDTVKAKFVYRDFPLTSIHPQAQPAAEAAQCANERGRFWEYHDALFTNQAVLSTAFYQQLAADLGLNTEQFNSCLDSGKYRSEVQKDFADGNAAGVTGTPTFYIGNDQIGYTKLVGAQPYSAFQSVIDQLLA